MARIGGGTRMLATLAVGAIAALAVAIALWPGTGPRATQAPTAPIALVPTSSLPSGTPAPTLPAAPTPGPTASPAPGSPHPPAMPACPSETNHFPTGFGAYHTYAGLCRAVVAAAAAHPDIARLESIGTSWEGRQILAMEIGTHVADGSHPPGVLFDGGTHGLEHLSVEMPLAVMAWLLDGYGKDATVTRLVQTRAIFLVFDVNPDGAAFDLAGGRFHQWRKNRQPNADGSIGTDLNRNYADHWGCCGLVSSTPRSSYYRGAAPFSAPETRALRDFIEAHVFDGRQEIRAAITFHASGRLVLWPYGYTRTAIPHGMNPTDHDIFVALAKHMASLNGYTPEQASSLYIDSGTERDWDYGAEGIFAFTFELGTGTYQRSSVIATETARNRSAVLYLIEMAGCPGRATVTTATTCA
ncbi:MAG TPA: M14 family zinc carboxypeptidase [Candidatus Dormibacteraeota bacterium]|nr:M14 family zinc carboxypeptidase [Candidatus Dormibacteraeota bacterium]